MVCAVDPQHYAEVDVTREDQPLRGWRVRCACSWTGLWRESLGDAVAEYDDHLAEYGIFVFDGAWWLRLPHMVPGDEILADPVAMSTACRIWAVEAAAELDRVCRWVRAPGAEPGR